VKLGKKYLGVGSSVLWIGKSFPNLSFIVLRLHSRSARVGYTDIFFGGGDTKATPTYIGARVVGSASAVRVDTSGRTL